MHLLWCMQNQTGKGGGWSQNQMDWVMKRLLWKIPDGWTFYAFAASTAHKKSRIHKCNCTKKESIAYLLVISGRWNEREKTVQKAAQKQKKKKQKLTINCRCTRTHTHKRTLKICIKIKLMCEWEIKWKKLAKYIFCMPSSLQYSTILTNRLKGHENIKKKYKILDECHAKNAYKIFLSLDALLFFWCAIIFSCYGDAHCTLCEFRLIYSVAVLHLSVLWPFSYKMSDGQHHHCYVCVCVFRDFDRGKKEPLINMNCDGKFASLVVRMDERCFEMHTHKRIIWEGIERIKQD